MMPSSLSLTIHKSKLTILVSAAYSPEFSFATLSNQAASKTDAILASPDPSIRTML